MKRTLIGSLAMVAPCWHIAVASAQADPGNASTAATAPPETNADRSATFPGSPPATPSTPPAGFDSFAPPAVPGTREEGNPSQWYGLPMVVGDAVGLALIGIGAGADADNLKAVGAAVMVVDGLLVHPFAYPSRQAGTGIAKGALSLVMRGGLGLGACAIGSGCFDRHQGDEATARMTLGLVVAAIIDDAWLARRTLSTGPVAVTSIASHGAGDIHPNVLAGPGLVALGIQGAW